MTIKEDFLSKKSNSIGEFYQKLLRKIYCNLSQTHQIKKKIETSKFVLFEDIIAVKPSQTGLLQMRKI